MKGSADDNPAESHVEEYALEVLNVRLAYELQARLKCDRSRQRQ